MTVIVAFVEDVEENVAVVSSSIFVPPNLFLTVYTPSYPILPDIVKTSPIEILSYNSLLIPLFCHELGIVDAL